MVIVNDPVLMLPPVREEREAAAVRAGFVTLEMLTPAGAVTVKSEAVGVPLQVWFISSTGTVLPSIFCSLSGVSDVSSVE